MVVRATWIFAGWLVLLPCRTATAADCYGASKLYNHSVDQVFASLRSYAQCIELSQGRDPCILAFARVESARSQFEASVRDFTTWCALR